MDVERSLGFRHDLDPVGLLAPVIMKINRRARNLVQRIRAGIEVRRALSEDDPPILIYQMGKVGSSTVRASLAGAGLDNRTLSVHFLSEAVFSSRANHRNVGLYPHHLHVGLALRPHLGDLIADGCKIISLIREPVARELSNVFENPALLGIRDDIRASHSSAELLEALDIVRGRLQDLNTYQYFFNWFDNELKTTLGVDVFSRPFPKDRGWMGYSSGRVEVLVLRLEDLSNVGEPVISEFLGLSESLELVASNVRTYKAGADSYRWIRDHLHLDRATCEAIYAHRAVSHFYGKDSIDRFIGRWC